MPTRTHPYSGAVASSVRTTIFYEAILWVIDQFTYDNALNTLSVELELDKSKLDEMFENDYISDRQLAEIIYRATHVSTNKKVEFIRKYYL